MRSRKDEMEYEGQDGDENPAVGEQLQLIEADHPARKKLMALARGVKRTDLKRKEAQDEREKLCDKITETMAEHKLEGSFRVGDIEIQVKPGKTKVSVRGVKEEDADEGDGD